MNAVDFILLFLLFSALFAALRLRKKGRCGDCDGCISFGKCNSSDKKE